MAPPPGVEREIRIPINGEGFAEYAATVLEAFKRRAEDKGFTLAKSYEGIRLSIPGKGWLLLRKSLHDPLLPLNIEGVSEAACRELVSSAFELMAGFEQLELPNID